jgi:hypothetical protein
MKLRIVLGAAGILLGLFGVYRLLTQIPNDSLEYLSYWLIGALILHDGIVSPVVAALGAGVGRYLPHRARRYLQGALVCGALITVIALPLIHRENSQPRAKAILLRDYAANLAILLGIVAAATLLLYLGRVMRDHRRSEVPDATGPEPAGDD